jgi:hypothetical protein
MANFSLVRGPCRAFGSAQFLHFSTLASAQTDAQGHAFSGNNFYT